MSNYYAGPFGEHEAPIASTSAQDTSEYSKPSKRKVSHISRACLQCRRRKIRCDGAQPSCTSCEHVGQSCQYSNLEDGRKAGAAQRSKHAQRLRASHDGTQGGAETMRDLQRRNSVLRTRLLALERALSRRGVSVAEALEEFEDLSSSQDAAGNQDITASRASSEHYKLAPSETDGDGLNGSDSADGVTDLDRLHLDDMPSSTLCHYGPTSALNHLSAADPSLQSPLSVGRHSQSPTSRDLGSFGSSFGSQLPGMSASSAFPWLKPKQDIAWDRNLPDLGLTRDVHDALLELCEAFFTPWNWVLDFIAFRRDMQVCLSSSVNGQQPPSRTPFYSPLLHNMALAMGACMWHGDRIGRTFPPINEGAVAEGADDRDTADMVADTLYKRAKECFDVECERPMQSLVNGLLLMASFNSGRARPNLGHVLFNCAVASSHALGVNIDCTDFVKKGLITAETKASRDNLFYTVYTQDKLWSMAIGRFTNIGQEDHNIQCPPPDPKYDKLPWIAPRVWRDVDANGLSLASGQPGYISTCFVHTKQLALIQHTILKKFYSLKPDVRSPAQLQTVDTLQAELEAWHADLPETIQLQGSAVPPPHVLTMHITYHYAVMLLHRPIFQRLLHKNPQHQSVRACDAAATRVVELLGLYDHFYSLNHAPLSSIQTTFVAGSVHLLKGLDAAKKTNAAQLHSALQGGAICIASLEKSSLSWRTSFRISRILQSLYNEWLPNSIQHMRQNGWLAPEPSIPSPAATRRPQQVPQHIDRPEAPHASASGLSQMFAKQGATAPSMYHSAATYTPASGQPPAPLLYDASTQQTPLWQGAGHYDHSNAISNQSIDRVLSLMSQDAGYSNELYPFAATSAQNAAEAAETPSSSSDFLRELLSHQQYQSNNADFGTQFAAASTLDMQTLPGANWADPTPSNDILSSFDFSIEAFNEMLKSTMESENALGT